MPRALLELGSFLETLRHAHPAVTQYARGSGVMGMGHGSAVLAPCTRVSRAAVRRCGDCACGCRCRACGCPAAESAPDVRHPSPVH